MKKTMIKKYLILANLKEISLPISRKFLNMQVDGKQIIV
jgi:hypothetical protein